MQLHCANVGRIRSHLAPRKIAPKAWVKVAHFRRARSTRRRHLPVTSVVSVGRERSMSEAAMPLSRWASLPGQLAVSALALAVIATIFWKTLALAGSFLPAFFVTIVMVLPLAYAVASALSPDRPGGQHR
jgi:hypothetical protein